MSTLNTDFVMPNTYNEKANFTDILFGERKPVLTSELNELQSLLRGHSKNVINSIFGSGILGVGTITLANNMLTVANEKAIISGELLTITSQTLSVSEGNSVYLTAWYEDKISTDTIKEYGNTQTSTTVTNQIEDDRFGETSRRKQLMFNLSKVTLPSGLNLKLGKITGGKFVQECNNIADNLASDMLASKISIKDVQNIFNATNVEQALAELMIELRDARDGEASLKARLERDLLKGKVVTETKEGEYISFDATQSSPITNVLVKGKTVQDASNLVDIKSTGKDLGDGTFLYEITSCGENLFNKDTVIADFYPDHTNGNLVSSNLYYTSDYIRIDPTKTYIRNTVYADQKRFAFYDKDKKFTNGDIYGNLVPNPNSCYVRVSLLKADLDNFKLQEGTVSTPYTEYEETKSVIKLPVQLESVGNISDILYFDTEENAWCIYKYIVTEVFNGSENWTINRLEENSQYIRFLYKPSGYTYPQSTSGEVKLISSLLPFNSDTYVAESIFSYPEHGVIACILKSKLVSANITGWKDYLNKNNMLIKYQGALQKIVLPKDTQIQLNSFLNKTNVFVNSGEITAIINATISKSVSSTVEFQGEEIKELQNAVADLADLKESQDLTYSTDNGYKVCKATKNGVVKDLKVQGKTIVNVLPKLSKLGFGMGGVGGVITNQVNGVFTGISSNDNYYAYDGETIAKSLYPNSQYTVKGFVEIDCTVAGTINVFYISLVEGVNQTRVIKSYKLSVGKNYIPISEVFTTDDLCNGTCGFYTNNVGTVNSLKFMFMMLQGDVSKLTINSHIEGIASVKNTSGIKVLTRKEDGNLFNKLSKDMVERGTDKWQLEGNTFSANPTSRYNSDIYYYVKVETGQNYTLSASSINATVVIYNGRVDRHIGDNLISSIHPTKKQQTFSTKENWITLRITNEELIGEVSVTEIQLNKGNDKKEYTSYKEDKKPLLYKDIDNTWKPITELNHTDLIDTTSNKYYKKSLGFKPSNPNGEWRDNGTNNPGFKTYWCRYSGYLVEWCVCNKLPVYDVAVMDKKCAFTLKGKDLIYVTVPTSECADVSKLDAWFKANDIEFILPIQNKEYEINLSNLDAYEGDTLVSIESENVPSSATFNVSSYTNNVIIEQGEAIDKLEDITSQTLLELNNKSNTDHVHDDRYLRTKKDSIGVGADLNNYVEDGIYTISSQSTILNAPYLNGIYGTMLVYTRTFGGVVQEFTDTSNVKFIRYYHNVENSWRPWAKVFTTYSKPSWEDVVNKPSTFTPSTHTHDDRYYTETESDSRFFRLNVAGVNDFNDAKAPGTYSLSGNIDRPNSPIPGSVIYGTLEVIPRGADLVQRVTLSTGAMFIRYFGDDAQGWRPWIKVFTDGNKPSWSDVINKPSTFTPASHTHDDRYFTETEADSRFLGKTAKAIDSEKLDGIDSTGFGRAYSSYYSFGGNDENITTEQFINTLKSLGALSTPYWMVRGSWVYANNQKITDTGCGTIHLAGCTVEVMGTTNAFTIRVHTATTSSGGVTHGDYIYVNNGDMYSPGWRRLYNTSFKPTPSDIGASPTSHNHDGRYTFQSTYDNELKTDSNSEDLTNNAKKSFKAGTGVNGSSNKDYSSTMKKSVIDLEGISGTTVKTDTGNLYNTLLNVVSSDVAPVNVLTQKLVNSEKVTYTLTGGELVVNSVDASWGYVQFEVPVTPYSKYMLDFKFTENTGNMWVSVSQASTTGVPVITDITYKNNGESNIFNVGNTTKIYIKFYSNVFISEGSKTVRYREVNLIKVKGSLNTNISLRALPHGVKDVYSNGKYIKRVKKFYLKDVPEWTLINGSKTNKVYTYKIPGTPDVADRTKVVLNCNYYNTISDATMASTDQTAVSISDTGKLIVACQIGDGQALKQHLQLYAQDAFVEVEMFEEVYDVPNSLVCDPGDTIYIGTYNQTVNCTHTVQLNTKSQMDAILNLIKENGYNDIDLTKLVGQNDYKHGKVNNCFYTVFPDGTCIQWGQYNVTFNNNNTAFGYINYPITFRGDSSCTGGIASSSSGYYSEWTCSILDDTEFRARVEVGKYNREMLNGVTVRVNWIATGRM